MQRKIIERKRSLVYQIGKRTGIGKRFGSLGVSLYIFYIQRSDFVEKGLADDLFPLFVIGKYRQRKAQHPGRIPISIVFLYDTIIIFDRSLFYQRQLF
ncbi:unknown [Bacteroides sp. CAG:144]|nr:unknown [Bacteroides sp. CAG:144]